MSRACHETELQYLPAEKKKTIAVVGSGPAGLSFAAIAALRGHAVTLFEQNDKIGGQLNIANQIPGKEEFNETLRYFKTHLKLNGVKVCVNSKATAEKLSEESASQVWHRLAIVGIAWRQLHCQQFSTLVDDQMEFEAEKPAHCGFAQFGKSVKHAVSLDSFVSTDCQGRRVNEGDAGVFAVTRLQIST